MRRIHLLFLPVLAVGCAPGRSATTAMMPAHSAFRYPGTDTADVLHLLNRLTFGAKPGDIAHVQRVGYSRWLDEQLQLPRNSDTIQETVRQRYPLAFESPDALWREYPPPQLQQQLARRAAAQTRGRADSTMPNGMPTDSMNGAARLRDGAPARLNGPRLVGGQAVMATLTRHAAGQQQLLEVMTDFWFNHFNVFIGKNQDRYVTADYVENAIRAHALGRFDDLLLAVARHPAMLVYLDNALSVAPGAMPPQRRGPFAYQAPLVQQRRPATGINENYGRELLELHTLGVDGGYTQADVQAAARILTGWSVSPPQRGGFRFEYHDWAHDRTEKTILGQTFPAGHGQDEGERLLHLLAMHPSTARHIAHKLCARFVADDPPDGCVDHAVSAWNRTGGDIRAVIRAIVESEDFWAAANQRAKTKTPLEFVLSAMRAIGATPDTTLRLAGALQMLGQPLFQQQVPTGYPETQAAWVNSGALLGRMNVAVAMGAGRLPGTSVDLDPVIPLTDDKDALIARINAVVLGGRGSASTLDVMRRQIADIPDSHIARAYAVGLALGSPDFQKQ